MTAEGSTPFLTAGEVAEELGMTRDGVYKLVRRGKLKAIRRSERQMLVSRLALDAYRRRLEGQGPDTRRPHGRHSLAELRAAFQRDTGRTPEDWIADWKTGDVEDSADNVRLTVQALGLRGEGSDEARKSSVPDWAVAAFTDAANRGRP